MFLKHYIVNAYSSVTLQVCELVTALTDVHKILQNASSMLDTICSYNIMDCIEPLHQTISLLCLYN